MWWLGHKSWGLLGCSSKGEKGKERLWMDESMNRWIIDYGLAMDYGYGFNRFKLGVWRGRGYKMTGVGGGHCG